MYEQDYTQKVSDYVFQYLDINQETFFESYDLGLNLEDKIFMNNKNHEWIIGKRKDVARRQNKQFPRKLTERKTKKIIKYESELRKESYNKLASLINEDLKESYDIQATVIRDQVWQKFQIEQEDYELAINQFELYDDPEIIKIQQSVEDKAWDYPELIERINAFNENPQDDNPSEPLQTHEDLMKNCDDESEEDLD